MDKRVQSIIDTVKAEALKLKDIEKDKAVVKQVCQDVQNELPKLKELSTDKVKSAFNLYFVDYLKNNYMEFGGRISRRQYWMFALFSILVGIVIGIVAGIIPILSPVSVLYLLAILVPSIGLAVRRLHDIGLSGWFFLISIIPYVGMIALLLLLCLPGDAKTNAYGVAK